jgi:hypothetical protein
MYRCARGPSRKLMRVVYITLRFGVLELSTKSLHYMLEKSRQAALTTFVSLYVCEYLYRTIFSVVAIMHAGFPNIVSTLCVSN